MLQFKGAVEDGSSGPVLTVTFTVTPTKDGDSLTDVLNRRPTREIEVISPGEAAATLLPRRSNLSRFRRGFERSGYRVPRASRIANICEQSSVDFLGRRGALE